MAQLFFILKFNACELKTGVKKMITISKIDGEVWLKVYDASRNLIHSDGDYRSISEAMDEAAYLLS